MMSRSTTLHRLIRGLVVTALAFNLGLGVGPEGASLAVHAAEPELPTLSHTRQLRRVLLTLEGRAPTMTEYQAVLDAPDEAARDALIAAQIETSLESEAFYEGVFDWGKEVLRVGRYDHNAQMAWTADVGIILRACGSDTLHAGRLGILYNGNGWGCANMPDCSAAKSGDSPDLCDDPTAPVAEVEPWWAPGTTVGVIGTATSAATEVPDASNPGQMRDCGRVSFGYLSVWKNDNSDASVSPRCGCGPNLIYCSRRANQAGQGNNTLTNGQPHRYDGFSGDPTGQRRHIFEEPARLWAHLIVNERPFEDVLVGNYTVATPALKHVYVRNARQQTKNKALDQSDWWQTSTPMEWEETVVETIHPSLVAARDVTFDPRVELGEPSGIPAAGVLTTIGSLGSFERERPRAARWLEVFTCREFSPPPPEADLGEFVTDPATEGVCQHCHKTMDPAAIHFKRFDMTGRLLLGMSPWRWDDFPSYNSQRRRWDASFTPNTWMTPITDADLDLNPDARFIDFLPPGYELLGVPSDGTIGPLGFGKMVVASGQFDRCMVKRFYERFGGVTLDPGRHSAYIDKLATGFKASGRNAKALIATIVNESAFKLGR